MQIMHAYKDTWKFSLTGFSCIKVVQKHFVPSGFLTMCPLRKELFLNLCLLQSMLVAELGSLLEAMFWSVELVRGYM